MIQSIVPLINCVSGAWLTSKKRLTSMFMLGGGSGGNGDKPAGGNALNGLLPALLSLLAAEKSGLALGSEKKGANGDQPGADTKSAGEGNH